MKKRFLVRRGLLVGAVALTGCGSLALATPAGASAKQVSAAGSFTTYQVMHNIFGPSLNDLLSGGNTTHQRIAATAELCKTGINFTTATKYPTGAPNGSTAGKNYLKAEEPVLTATATVPATKKHLVLTHTGCVDFSRSSSPPKTSTASTHFDYYAYALDGVAPLVGANAGGDTGTPVTLPLGAMKGIYLCKPGYSNWNTVTGAGAAAAHPTTHLSNQGGVTAPIVRFWPQAGSGTRSVYTSMLGFTPGTTTYHTSKGSTCGTASHPTADRPYTKFTTVGGATSHVTKVNEENSEEGIIYYSSLHPTQTLSGTKTKTIQDAVFIYSAGKFEQQWNTRTATVTTGLPSRYTEKAVNRITGKNTLTAGTGKHYGIGNFNASTLFLAKMQATTASHTKSEFLVYGNPLSGTFTATSNRGTEAINTTVIKEANEWFSHIPAAGDNAKTSKAVVPGVRYIYNVADTALPTYSEAKMMIGFDNQATGAKSALCHGDDASAISSSGFVPLNSGSTAPANTGGGYGSGGTAPAFSGSSDLDGAYCREFPGKHLPTYGGSKAWTSSHFVQST